MKEFKKRYIDWFFKPRTFFPTPDQQFDWFMENIAQQPKEDDKGSDEYSDEKLLEMATKLIFVIWERRKVDSFLRTTVKVNDSGREYELVFMDISPDTNKISPPQQVEKQ